MSDLCKKSSSLNLSFSSDDGELSSSKPDVSLFEFKALDNLLRCPSCYDYIHTAMILPNCHHNFCSLCIRKYFCFKTQCPACSAQASGPELRNNRILDNIIDQYKKIRKPLKKLLRQTENVSSCLQGEKQSSVVAAVNSLLPNISKDLSIADVDSEIEIWDEESKKVATKFTDYDSDSDFHGEKQNKVLPDSCRSTKEKFDEIFPSTSDQKTPRWTGNTEKKNGFTMLKDESMLTPVLDKCLPSCSTPVSSQDTPNGTKVDCPVCGVSVRQMLINKHLDNCLHKTEKVESLRSNKKKPLTKVVYHLMSDKDIRNRLKDLGLSADGDRKVLIKRHQEFSLLHNSDCDSLNPKSTPELVRYFEKNERLRKKLSDTSSHKGLDIGKNADQEEIRQAQKSYAKQHKNQFKDLIEQARNKSKDSNLKTTLPSSEEKAYESKSDLSEESTSLAQVIKQSVDDISRLVSNSSQESFELFPVEDEVPQSTKNIEASNSFKDSNSNNLNDDSDLHVDDAFSVKTPCRKSLFDAKSVNGDTVTSPIPQSPKIGNNMFLSPGRWKSSNCGGTLYVDDSESEMGDSTPSKKNQSCIENSVNTTGSSELWPALSVKNSHQGDSENGDMIDDNGDIFGDSGDESDGDASDIIPVCETQPPSIDSIIRPTRLSLQLRQSNSLRKSERQKRKAENNNEDGRPSKKLKNC